MRAYGDDPLTEQATKEFKKHFGDNARAFFVLTGTAANVLSIEACLKPYEALVCADCAHINTDECGAPEKIARTKVISIATNDAGKITVDAIARACPLENTGFVHF